MSVATQTRKPTLAQTLKRLGSELQHLTLLGERIEVRIGLKVAEAEGFIIDAGSRTKMTLAAWLGAYMPEAVAVGDDGTPRISSISRTYRMIQAGRVAFVLGFDADDEDSLPSVGALVPLYRFISALKPDTPAEARTAAHAKVLEVWSAVQGDPTEATVRAAIDAVAPEASAGGSRGTKKGTKKGSAKNGSAQIEPEAAEPAVVEMVRDELSALIDQLDEPGQQWAIVRVMTLVVRQAQDRGLANVATAVAALERKHKPTRARTQKATAKAEK